MCSYRAVYQRCRASQYAANFAGTLFYRAVAGVDFLSFDIIVKRLFTVRGQGVLVQRLFHTLFLEFFVPLSYLSCLREVPFIKKCNREETSIGG